MKEKFEKLDEQELELEEEWTKFKETFIGEAVDLCGRTKGKGRRKNQEWWTTQVAEAIKAKREAWKKIESTKKEGKQPDAVTVRQYRVLKKQSQEGGGRS